MSVLIRGMEMPKNCDSCPCYYETEGAWRNECQVLNREHYITGERPDWCPLVPVPDHGRLIDADALGIAEHEERFAKRADRGDWMDEYIVGIVDGLHEAGRRIINAPTIIPADKEVDE